MEINLTNLECKRLALDTFQCVANQTSTPVWFYPLVIACFVISVLVLLLVAKMTLDPRHRFDRRVDYVPVKHDRRKP